MKPTVFSSYSARWQTFWFQPISAVGFGLMRIAFGLTALLTFLSEWSLVELFYGPRGILPREMGPSIFRHDWHFSLLLHASSFTTHALYLLLLVTLVCVILGFWTRTSVLLSVILMYSFHEYGQITLDSGDTLQRLIGFILVLSPCGRAMSIDSLRRRLKSSRDTGTDIDAEKRTMPIWLYRLLLWQMIVLYTSAVMEKWSGTTWISGSAVAITLHHPHFTRLTPALANTVSYLSPMIGDFTLITQSLWIALLIIPIFIWLNLLPKNANGTLKRALLLAGLLTHGGIMMLMDVGTFSLIVFAGYFGLLIDEDFSAMRRFFNRSKGPKKTIILFDGRCGLCNTMIILLRSLDWLQRLQFENYHDSVVREKYAKGISMKDLDEMMHVRSSRDTMKKGFFGFRLLTKQLPLLWTLVPILYVPGVPMIGEKVYGWVAKHRPRTRKE